MSRRNGPVSPLIWEPWVDSYPIHCGWVWAAGSGQSIMGGDKLLSIHRRISSERKWSFVEQLCVRSSPGPTPVCLEPAGSPGTVLSHHSLPWSESAASWQDLGQIVPDYTQAELTRILKEINASHCTTIRNLLIQSKEMKPAGWNVGMLENRSRNVSLPFCPWWSGNWYGLILLFTLVLWTFVLPPLLTSINICYMICFYAFMVEAKAFQTFPLKCHSPEKKKCIRTQGI